MFYVILWGLLLLICIGLLIYNLVLLMGIVYKRCKKRISKNGSTFNKRRFSIHWRNCNDYMFNNGDTDNC